MSEESQLLKAMTGKMASNASLDPAHYNVAALTDVVALAGHVQSFTQQLSVGTAVWRVKSVRALVEDLAKDLPFDGRFDVGDTASAALNQLGCEAPPYADGAHVETEKHWNEGTGEAACRSQRDAALHGVSHLLALVVAANRIPFRPAQIATSISDDTTHALYRRWFFDPKTALVRVNNGVVDLVGEVCSWQEEAAHTGWAAAAIVAAQNDVTVV